MVNQKGSKLFAKYIEIALKRTELETEREVLFLAEQSVQETPFVMQRSTRVNSNITKGFCAPSIINQANISLNRREKALLKLGPKYIPNNPRLAHLRMTKEIELVVKKINKNFVEHGWVLPKQRLQIFIDSLEKILIECHDRHPTSTQLKKLLI